MIAPRDRGVDVAQGICRLGARGLPPDLQAQPWSADRTAAELPTWTGGEVLGQAREKGDFPVSWTHERARPGSRLRLTPPDLRGDLALKQDDNGLSVSDLLPW